LWVPFRVPDLPTGLQIRPLRRLDNGTLRSAIVKMPAGWDSGGYHRIVSRLQMYVLAGTLQLGNRNLDHNTYLNYSNASVMPRLGSEHGAEFLIVCDGPPGFETVGKESSPDDAIIIDDVPRKFQQRQENPEAMGGWTLCEDPQSGATTRFLKVPPSWNSPGAEYHPCQEEILCLSGDIAPDDTRLLKPGWFLWNPAYGVHGFNLHSVAGGTVLEWHDGPWEKLASPAP